jgi:hypothetical protein
MIFGPSTKGASAFATRPDLHDDGKKKIMCHQKKKSKKKNSGVREFFFIFRSIKKLMLK